MDYLAVTVCMRFPRRKHSKGFLLLPEHLRGPWPARWPLEKKQCFGQIAGLPTLEAKAARSPETKWQRVPSRKPQRSSSHPAVPRLLEDPAGSHVCYLHMACAFLWVCLFVQGTPQTGGFQFVSPLIQSRSTGSHGVVSALALNQNMGLCPPNKDVLPCRHPTDSTCFEGSPLGGRPTAHTQPQANQLLNLKP